MSATPLLDAVIVGSGFSGLGMAVSLARAGKKFVVLEKGSGVGGTWRDNRYPGCACDVQSHLYSFSFAPNPNWSRAYAPQKEILAYLEKVATDFAVRPHCHFHQEVEAATWDESKHVWTVRTHTGVEHRARHLVFGIGGLHHPKLPNVPGRERFQGLQLHSAEWDERADLTGKRVVVVGTGASAIQLVPALAPHVKQLTLLQRTPAWVLPRNDGPIGAFWKWLYRVLPFTMLLSRLRIYALAEAKFLAFKRRWLMELGEKRSKAHLKKQVKDPRLQQLLTPTYAAGCKRILVSDDYYPAFNRENVTLEPCAVSEVTEKGVRTPDGRELECDAIAWCTGFDVAAPLKRMKVTGVDGKDLATEGWTHGLRAYKGTTIPGFPNLYMLMGPNTGLGHNSMVYMIESQIHFVMQHLRALEQAGATAIEVKADVERRYNDELMALMPQTPWTSGCTSWYLDDQRRPVMLWPKNTWAFRAQTRALSADEVTMRGTARASTSSELKSVAAS